MKLVLIQLQKLIFDIRKNLYGNVIMSGGTAMFEGIVEELQ